jgi:hypothetical protein
MDYPNYYLDQLYPLQDKYLKFLDQHDPGQFYLTGVTALSRFYFQHRYSDDLDFFSCEEHKDFRSIVNTILDKTKKNGFVCEVETLSDNFLRFFLTEGKTVLKIDFVNEMLFHWGKFQKFPLFSHIAHIERANR